ncbi:MAG: heavy metal translocating P-type ATPase [Bacteroidales bacterium]
MLVTAQNTLKARFPVTGMSCAACAGSVESMLRSAAGVSEVSVNYAGQEVSLQYDPEITGPAEFQKSLRSIGYDIIIVPGKEKELLEEYKKNHYRQLTSNTLGAAIFSVPVFVLSMFMHIHFPGKNWLLALLTLPVIAVFGQTFFVTAYKQAKHRRTNMDTLVALSTGIAFLFSLFNVVFPQVLESRGLPAVVYFESAAVIVTFILFGRLLEEKARNKTSGALKKLIGLQPKTVTRILQDTEEECGIEQLTAGDIVLIRPGDRIPVDGIIIEGYSSIDESSISGESVPAEKNSGDKAFAGTVNQQGLLKIRALKVGSDTLLGQIIRRVEEAQNSKAPIQKTADKVAGIFVPVVLIISIITFLLWFVAGGFSYLPQGFLTMISVLIIACPCALGLATPTAIITGMGKGAETGILFKDAQSLELMRKVDVVVLDKTGTLTFGKPVVSDFKGDESPDVMAILKEIENRSDHPLASAVVNYLSSVKSSKIVFQQFDNIPGRGIAAKVGEDRYLVGNALLLEDHGCFVSEYREEWINWEQQGKTIVFFSRNEKLLAMIALSDPVRDTTASAVKELIRSGKEVWMLTGDREVTAEYIAGKVGITDFKAGVLPEEKANFIRELQEQGKIVAMVGDGINDSAALALADVGIAMNKGSDIAIESAGVTLVHNDLQQLQQAFTLSSKTVMTIHQNLFWAFIYNGFAIPLAAGILYPVNGFLLSPMIAGAAMALSSVSVVTNSLRLKAVKL